MLLKGTILRNRYQIIRHLGSGGFADTYLSEDRDLPGHPQCVVKNLKPTSPDPAVLPIARRLFETEAQVLYLLGQHEQIPKLFAHFEENGEFYLVQEFIDGYDLTAELAPGKRFSEQEVIKLLQNILEVLVVVHQKNIIHRDIKPQNIMRRRYDEKIVLIDFGAVKEIGSLAVNTQGQVKSTITIGTPGYMPNEQANRDPKLSSDIYAVGMIGIQALTGLLPQQLLQDPTTGELNWRNYVQVSNKLADVLTKMIHYHFSQRYQSAYEALQAIKALAPKAQTTELSTSSILRMPQIPRSLIQPILIGIGGLAIGIIATFTLINRPQSATVQPATTPATQSPIASSPASTATQSQETKPEPTDLGEPKDSGSISAKPVNFAIAPKFDGAGLFSEGLAEVRVNGKWGYIDKTGTIVIQPKFDETQAFSEGLAIVWIAGENTGYIDKTGNYVIDPRFAKGSTGKFSEGLARLCLASTCGYINKTEFVIDRKFLAGGDFSEGLAAIKDGDKWGYIDKTGSAVIKPKFDNAGNFYEGLAVVKIGDKWGYIDKTGNVVIKPQFDDKGYSSFSEGLAVVKIGDKWGYIDKTGNVVIKPLFDDAFDFAQGLARIQSGEKFGFIDKTGNVVIKPQFDNAGSFFEGLARVKSGDKWGYIDKTGKVIIEPQFDDAGYFSEGLVWVTSGNKSGYITNPLK
ncbi:MAG: WG repeat-containing protein [Desmonostoc vinosum HA7617-LM4]|jgi:serine/threonine protein kinase|nr:WG repeat-containing protein [Desmonostoc vinosum HA7617-LM4]